MKKFDLGQLFHACWFIFFALICLLICLHRTYYIISFAIGALLFAAAILTLKKSKIQLNQANRGQQNLCMLMLLGLLFAGMVYVGGNMLIEPFSDSGRVWFTVADIIETGRVSQVITEYDVSNHDYFLMYPANRFMVSTLLILGSFLHNVCGIGLRTEAAYMSLIILNACLMTAGVAFVSLAVRRERGHAAATLLQIFSLVFLPFHLNAYKVYSDTMSFPFVCLALYLTIRADHSQKHSLLWRAASGLAIGLGILMKGSVWVFVIALAIYLAIRCKGWKQKCRQIVCALLCVLVVTQTWSVASNNLSWLNYEKSDRYKMPAIHWVMMSASGNGRFHKEDYDFSMSYETLAERKAADMQELQRRLKAMGPVGYVKLLIRKIVATYADGLYSQTAHLERFESYPVGSIVSPSGKYFNLLKLATNSILCTIYLGILASGLINARRKSGTELLLNVCMFGLVCLFCLWETKSRYLLNFSPMFLMIAVFAIDDLAEHFNGFRSKNLSEQSR